MKKFLIFITIVAALFAGLFYFRSDIQKGIAQFQNTDLALLIEQIKKEILAPPPLKFFGPDTKVTLTADKVVVETNLQREANGLAPLKENEKLKQSALDKANDMFKDQYFEHISPSGVGPGELVSNNNYDYIAVGENLILGNFSSEKEVVQKWMESPGHRENILNKRYTEIGVAMVKGEYQGRTVWIGVQEFGLPASVCPKPSEYIKNDITTHKYNLDQLSAQISQKKSQINNSNPRSSEYKELVREHNDLVAQYNALVQKTKSLISQYNIQVYNFNNCISTR